MKSCAYCGKENDDAATSCVECGTQHFTADATATTASQPPVFSWRDVLTDPVKLFRALVVVATAAYLLSVVTPYVEPLFLSYDTLDLLNHNGHGALIALPAGMFWLTLLIYVAVAVGLYQFSATARAVFVILTVGFGLLVLFSGVTITSPLVGFLALIFSMADGAILLLAYATPLRERFVS